jgi:hypothetical protein
MKDYAAYLWRRIRGRRHRRFLIATGVALLILGAGIAGYALATSKGVDSSADQVAAAHAGEKRGKAQGAKQGFARGFESARHHAYRAAYRHAYLAAYRAQFETAGLSIPGQVAVKGP